jgi:hypothetical protein
MDLVSVFCRLLTSFPSSFCWRGTGIFLWRGCKRCKEPPAWFPAFRIVRNKFLLWNHPICDVMLWKPSWLIQHPTLAAAREQMWQLYFGVCLVAETSVVTNIPTYKWEHCDPVFTQLISTRGRVWTPVRPYTLSFSLSPLPSDGRQSFLRNSRCHPLTWLQVFFF